MCARALLDRICQKDGDKPFAMMEPRHVRARRDQNADRPEAANAMVKALRQLFNFAIEYDLATRNPAKDVPYLKSHSEGFHSWSMDELTKFEDEHPVGSKARLALALLLYTGQRRSDVVRLGPQHVKDGWLSFTQSQEPRPQAGHAFDPGTAGTAEHHGSDLDRQSCVPDNRVWQAIYFERFWQLVPQALR